jgi:hypothetical protein
MGKYGTARQAIDGNIIGRMHLHTHTQNMYYLLLFHGNSRYVNAPPCYVIRTLPVLFKFVSSCYSFSVGVAYVHCNT